MVMVLTRFYLVFDLNFHETIATVRESGARVGVQEKMVVVVYVDFSL